MLAREPIVDCLLSILARHPETLLDGHGELLVLSRNGIEILFRQSLVN